MQVGGNRNWLKIFYLYKKRPGNYLLSHRLYPAVPSAQEGLTSVFGMVTGGSLPLLSPGQINDPNIRVSEYWVKRKGGLPRFWFGATLYFKIEWSSLTTD